MTYTLNLNKSSFPTKYLEKLSHNGHKTSQSNFMEQIEDTELEVNKKLNRFNFKEQNFKD